MSARLHLTIDILKNGTHILVTDIDNIFSRHVPLVGFLEEGYDVYHAFEMRYPVPIYKEFGYVICSGHQFLRSSPATLRFMELVMRRCRAAKCDDQITYNRVFFYDLQIQWDGGMETPNHGGALRVNTTHPENSGLLVESVTGRSAVTNHTIKIWDRDFAWRVSFLGATQLCVLQNAIVFARRVARGLLLPTPISSTAGGLWTRNTKERFCLVLTRISLVPVRLWHRTLKKVGRGNSRVLSVEE